MSRQEWRYLIRDDNDEEIWCDGNDLQNIYAGDSESDTDEHYSDTWPIHNISFQLMEIVKIDSDSIIRQVMRLHFDDDNNEWLYYMTARTGDNIIELPRNRIRKFFL